MEKIIKQPFLIEGDIMHHRFFEKTNKFNYKSTYISFPITEVSKLKNTLFSLEKFNLFSFYKSDHNNEKYPNDNYNIWIKKILDENKINNIENIVLFSHPRVLGYIFNPVSFWLCFDKNNKLIAVLSEVSNTCGQKHNYLCYKNGLEPINSDEWLEAKKVFYVSPFMKIEGNYKFRFEYKNEKMNFFINYLVDDKIKLATSLKCKFIKLNNKNLLKSFLKIPFATFKTTFLIHYQALKLVFKRIKFYKCPEKLENNLTINKLSQKNEK